MKITQKLNSVRICWCPHHSANKTKLTPAVALSPCKSPDPFQGRHQKLAFVIPGSARNSGLLFLKVWPMYTIAWMRRGIRSQCSGGFWYFLTLTYENRGQKPEKCVNQSHEFWISSDIIYSSITLGAMKL